MKLTSYLKDSISKDRNSLKKCARLELNIWEDDIQINYPNLQLQRSDKQIVLLADVNKIV